MHFHFVTLFGMTIALTLTLYKTFTYTGIKKMYVVFIYLRHPFRSHSAERGLALGGRRQPIGRKVTALVLDLILKHLTFWRKLKIWRLHLNQLFESFWSLLCVTRPGYRLESQTEVEIRPHPHPHPADGMGLETPSIARVNCTAHPLTLPLSQHLYLHELQLPQSCGKVAKWAS